MDTNFNFSKYKTMFDCEIKRDELLGEMIEFKDKVYKLDLPVTPPVTDNGANPISEFIDYTNVDKYLNKNADNDDNEKDDEQLLYDEMLLIHKSFAMNYIFPHSFKVLYNIDDLLHGKKQCFFNPPLFAIFYNWIEHSLLVETPKFNMFKEKEFIEFFKFVKPNNENNVIILNDLEESAIFKLEMFFNEFEELSKIISDKSKKKDKYFYGIECLEAFYDYMKTNTEVRMNLLYYTALYLTKQYLHDRLGNYKKKVGVCFVNKNFDMNFLFLNVYGLNQEIWFAYYQLLSNMLQIKINLLDKNSLIPNFLTIYPFSVTKETELLEIKIAYQKIFTFIVYDSKFMNTLKKKEIHPICIYYILNFSCGKIKK